MTVPDLEPKTTVFSVSIAENIVSDLIVDPDAATRLHVRIAKFSVGSCVLSLPETMWIHSLALEGTLSTIRCGNATDVLVTNFTGSPITLKTGILIGFFEVADSVVTR